MRIPRILTLQHLEVGCSIRLEPGASNHLVRVLRLRADDKIIVFNGDGKEYVALITEPAPKNALITIDSVQHPQRESSLNIEIGQGISRGERMDFVLQKSVELGVNTLIPLWTKRCQVQLGGTRLDKRITHWRSIVNAACEQSGRLVVPELQEPVSLEEWVAQSQVPLRVVLDPEASLPLTALEPASSIQVLIGPEGGLSNDEIAHAEEHGYMRVRLGPRILRTETATLAILTALQTLWGDFRN